MSYTIEKGIPIPDRTGWAAKLHATLNSMEIGDSLFVPKSDKSPQQIYSNLSSFKRKTGKAFLSRSAQNGTRIWRIG